MARSSWRQDTPGHCTSPADFSALVSLVSFLDFTALSVVSRFVISAFSSVHESGSSVSQSSNSGLQISLGSVISLLSNTVLLVLLTELFSEHAVSVVVRQKKSMKIVGVFVFMSFAVPTQVYEMKLQRMRVILHIYYRYGGCAKLRVLAR